MTKNPEKDFGPIADDYDFFECHATEAEQDARAYLAAIADAVPREGPIRLLDFGCGAGTFTSRFLTMAGWPGERLRLTLVEPVESACPPVEQSRFLGLFVRVNLG
jgi:ubiquinone/menaquinone biosynthesis C-methylase UbiE